ncbi:peptidylprolyl isomerase [Thiocapsa imhoffii]|uniref:peptidylprolyl isomerase n=2 Tax=Thiocapsa imhoffii TaxID=382777 RepID=A0A9X0WFH6_9GAMM|nr:peptidylprolyl isomerase [Thiocapsa imhoffii]MBK1643628.1 peptidylprolyl isomerase [Thiocapsa imhoffii]
MNIKRIPLILIAFMTATACSAEDTAEPLSGDVAIATVNGTPYSLDLFRLFYLERLQQNQGESSAELQEQAFNDFMSLIVASQEAARRQLEDDPQVAVAIELHRMKVLSNAALASMGMEIEPSEDQLKQAYEEIKANVARTEYKARHILVKEEDEAKELIQELEGGADFGDLARKHSLGPTGKNGGELDWFDANQMVAPFSEAVVAMEAGTFTKEPVQTQFGWHVIELQESREAQPPSYEEARPQLVVILKRQALGDQLIEMRDNAMVELNEDVVKFSPKDE